ncbi:tRNA (adenine(58)-n(1))-methyltransferase catalytic subunit trmt61a [Anaeramoeba ignava]|uniref:tRNA (adenine(58)-N(1))-methyltransferase n=1 Tax=Anaeramoeba ignava TaxID=1746090 RepID=A0A9Q0LHI4_ANAIG|nr:tRNA (adenine(58)-n(1))-methyltransferase catalytic subunit trmt61a [Anaeramoeba ignava]|eukprot:Anaeramoba_ignava/a223805_17.p1 GENE.a223805_17~~a223805_17.p1  ORF type:complete len:308 (-),score=90.81 a223805_17:118-1041(-)
MLSENEVCKEGDHVMIYAGRQILFSVVLEKGGQITKKFGTIKHKDIIGKKFGTRLGFVNPNYPDIYVLKPSPHLWTFCLDHFTQIIHYTDIAVIAFQLELRSGSIVLESGTGSASLTTSLAKFVAPLGHVHTFDIDSSRVENAKISLEKNGFGNIVSVLERNVVEQGFPFEKEFADSVVLDLPSPFLVIEEVARVLKKSGTICSFSPCIEQVQQTCSKLEENAFTGIETFECLLREHKVCVFGGFVDDEEKEKKQTEDQMEVFEYKRRKRKKMKEEKKEENIKLFTRAIPEARGHTGYLTFAKKNTF